MCTWFIWSHSPQVNIKCTQVASMVKVPMLSRGQIFVFSCLSATHHHKCFFQGAFSPISTWFSLLYHYLTSFCAVLLCCNSIECLWFFEIFVEVYFLINHKISLTFYHILHNLCTYVLPTSMCEFHLVPKWLIWLWYLDAISYNSWGINERIRYSFWTSDRKFAKTRRVPTASVSKYVRHTSLISIRITFANTSESEQCYPFNSQRWYIRWIAIQTSRSQL